MHAKIVPAGQRFGFVPMALNLGCYFLIPPVTPKGSHCENRRLRCLACLTALHSYRYLYHFFGRV